MYPCHETVWLVRPGRVLRKELRDLTVGHVYLLEAIESPFIVGGPSGLGDLAVAVLICSMPFDKGRQFLMQPMKKVLATVERWGFICRLMRLDFSKESEKFVDYLKAYTEAPDAFKKKGAKSRESACPISLRLAWMLMARMTEAEAWNCTMSRALAYQTAEAEYNGQEFLPEKDARRLELI